MIFKYLRGRVQRRRDAEMRFILLYLSASGPSQSFQIAQATNIGLVRTFRCLDELERRKCITAQWGDPIYPGGPRRRFYDLAPTNVEEL